MTLTDTILTAALSRLDTAVRARRPLAATPPAAPLCLSMPVTFRDELLSARKQGKPCDIEWIGWAYPTSLAHLCKHIDRIDSLPRNEPFTIETAARLLEITTDDVLLLIARGVLPFQIERDVIQARVEEVRQ